MLNKPLRILLHPSTVEALLINMLEAKANSERKLAAQAIAGLMILSQNRREIKKDSVPNLVQLFDPSQFLALAIVVSYCQHMFAILSLSDNNSNSLSTPST